ncbi:hypothetical protein [Bryobacter aggregatus]|uniref:hypothetical protein n=1 Tax=Bryobacter aggregatus TaxID=360054 RepID=UPI0004E1802D|nr:hypothetical protein [Bryobacter aggregatus]
MLPIFGAIARSAWREIYALGSIQGNNFTWFALLLTMQPESMGFIWALLGLLLVLPALTAPLAKIPQIRLALWPLEDWQRKSLRWLTKPETMPSPWLWRLAPVLELRQIPRTLDFWLAVLLATSGTAYRFLASKPDREAYPVIAMLVVLALSTLAQNLFALDGAGGRQRWKLSPIRGARVLARKGLWLLVIALILTAGLSPLGALAGMLAALAVGHHASVMTPIDAGAWRFSSGQFFPHGFFQVIGMFSCGIATARGEWMYLALAAAAYGISLMVYGWVLEKA